MSSVLTGVWAEHPWPDTLEVYFDGVSCMANYCRVPAQFRYLSTFLGGHQSARFRCFDHLPDELKPLAALLLAVQ